MQKRQVIVSGMAAGVVWAVALVSSGPLWPLGPGAAVAGLAMAALPMVAMIGRAVL